MNVVSFLVQMFFSRDVSFRPVFTGFTHFMLASKLRTP